MNARKNSRGSRGPTRRGKFGGGGAGTFRTGRNGNRSGCSYAAAAIALGVLLIAGSLGAFIGLAITAVTG